MFLVTTPTGNSGRQVLSTLLSSSPDAPIRVLVRDAKRLSAQVRARCEVVEGDLRDGAALAAASRGVRAAFFCIPLQSKEPEAVAAYHRSFFEPVASAFGDAGVQRVVTISGGRGEPGDVGPNGPLATMERAFDAVAPATRHVRCGYFMENFLHIVPLFKFKSSFSFPLDPGYPLALEAARDIGEEAAGWLLDPRWSGHQGVAVSRGEVLSCAEIASTMSRVLRKKVAYAATSSAAYETMLIKQGGLSEPMARSLREMFEDIGHGSLNGRGAKKSGGVPFATWTEGELKPAMGLLSVLKRIMA